MNVTIRISGDRETHAKLKKLGAGLLRFDKAMAETGKMLVEYYRGEAFASQGGVFGERWQRLSPSYAKAKAKEYPGRPPLVRTGRMQNSFNAKSGANSLVVGNSRPYFKYHQSTQPRKKIPRRPMLGVNDTIKRRIESIFKADIEDKIRKA